MSRTRIPEKIYDFDGYIKRTDDYLQSIDPNSGLLNWQRLGLSNANANDWHANRLEWDNTFLAKYHDATQNTSALKTGLRFFMRDFRTFANPLLAIMAASPAAGTDDEIYFHFKRKRRKPGYHEVPVDEQCIMFESRIMGQGALKITCRLETASRKPHKPFKADSIQVAYSINNPAALPEDNTTTKEIFTKCIFMLNAGHDDSPRRMYAWFRWYNIKHPRLAGRWSRMYTMVLS